MKRFERMTEEEKKIYQLKLQQSNLEEEDEIQEDNELEGMYYQ